MKIEEAIQQKSFENSYQKLSINLLFTAAWMTQQISQVLKPYNITWQQFNILRILRGMNPKPASIKVLTERMIDKMSNASRLVDKLMLKGLVERVSCPSDRRKVEVRLTPAGFDLLEKASEAMKENVHSGMEKFTEEELESLNFLLDKIRS